jgi:hypothetical protein
MIEVRHECSSNELGSSISKEKDSKDPVPGSTGKAKGRIGDDGCREQQSTSSRSLR